VVSIIFTINTPVNLSRIHVWSGTRTVKFIQEDIRPGQPLALLIVPTIRISPVQGFRHRNLNRSYIILQPMITHQCARCVQFLRTHKSSSFSSISSLSINSLTILSLALIFSSCLNFSSPSIFFFPVDAARAFRFLRASLALYSLMRLS
jgi:hypothetical protein